MNKKEQIEKAYQIIETAIANDQFVQRCIINDQGGVEEWYTVKGCDRAFHPHRYRIEGEEVWPLDAPPKERKMPSAGKPELPDRLSESADVGYDDKCPRSVVEALLPLIAADRTAINALIDHAKWMEKESAIGDIHHIAMHQDIYAGIEKLRARLFPLEAEEPKPQEPEEKPEAQTSKGCPGKDCRIRKGCEYSSSGEKVNLGKLIQDVEPQEPKTNCDNCNHVEETSTPDCACVGCVVFSNWEPQEPGKNCENCSSFPAGVNCHGCHGALVAAGETPKHWRAKPPEPETDYSHLPGERSADYSDPKYVSYQYRCVFCHKFMKGEDFFKENCPDNPGQKRTPRVFE